MLSQRSPEPARPQLPPTIGAVLQTSVEVSLAQASITRESPANPAPPPILSVNEVTARMKKDGFPELELTWKWFLKQGVSPQELSKEMIQKLSERHIAPPGKIETAVIVVAASVLSYAKFSWGIAPMIAEYGMVAKTALFGGVVANVGFFTLLGATYVRRYAVAPLAKVMGLEAGYMLSRRSYREALQKQSSVAYAELGKEGITTTWDNPEYRRWYKSVDGKVVEAPPRSLSEEVRDILKLYVGSKDPETRKFAPGRFINELQNGKESVTQFVQANGELIERLRAGTLMLPDAVALLTQLRAFLKESSSHHRNIDTAIEALRDTKKIAPSVVQAEIWQRDPWVDLTHQLEFFSSASLRGVKLVGRGPKGRIGCFRYLDDFGMTCLDLRTSRGRIVRARLVATKTRREGGAEVPLLFVDGVEGSNRLPPQFAQQAIEEYARASGFHAVAYNVNVLNKIPKRFVTSLITRHGSTSIRTIEVKGYTTSRSYLDAFGCPIEPFEYGAPRGKVIALVRPAAENGEGIGREVRWYDKVVPFLKRTVHWWVVGVTVGTGGAIVGITNPWAGIPIGLVTTGLLGAHFFYSRKSVSQGEEPPAPKV